MSSEQSRFEQVSRRAFLKRGAALGAAAAFPTVFLAACGSDTSAFESGSSTATTAAAAAEALAVTASPGTSGAALPAGAELVVEFTYEAGSTDRGGVKNPYVAVWVEDDAGDLVATVALWFLQSQKGLKWLSDLRRWTTVDGSDDTVDAISSATRAPGAYTVVWDGTTATGGRVTQGAYYLAIESSREHGPYSLIREAITLEDQPFTQSLEAQGELTDATVSLVLA